MQLVEQILELRTGGYAEPFSEFIRSNFSHFMNSYQLYRNFEMPSVVQTVEITSHGEFLFGGDVDGRISIWDLRKSSQAALISIQPDQTNINSIKQMQDNKIVVASNSGDIHVIEIAEGRENCKVLSGHHTRCVNTICPIDENVFLSCGIDKTLRIFDLRTKYSDRPKTQGPFIPQKFGGGPIQKSESNTDESLLFDFSKFPDGQLYCMEPVPGMAYSYGLTTGMSEVLMVDLRSPDEILSLFDFTSRFIGHQPLNGLAFDDFNEIVAVSAAYCRLHCFHPEYESPFSPPNYNVMMRTPAENVSPDIPFYASGHFDEELFARSQNQIRMLESTRFIDIQAQNPEPLQMFEFSNVFPSPDALNQVSFCGKAIVFGANNGRIYFCDPDNEKITGAIIASDSPIMCISTSLDHSYIGVATENTAKLFNPTCPHDVDVSAATAMVEQVLSENRPRITPSELISLLLRLT